jgi:hypothetical protein
VFLTPLLASLAIEDVALVALLNGQVVAQANMANVELTITENVRAANTPQGMKDRITLRKFTPVVVTVGKGAKAGADAPFFIEVEGNSSDNGVAKFNVDGTRRSHVFQFVGGEGRYGLDITGEQSTKATAGVGGGNAGKLKLHLTFQVGGGNQRILNEKFTAGFSVAAIPQAMRHYGVKLVDGEDRPGNPNPFWVFGVRFLTQVISDSGDVHDLDQVAVSERIIPQTNTATGVVKVKFMDGDVTSGFLAARNMPPDYNGVQKSAETRNDAVNGLQDDISDKGNGSGVQLQYHRFNDRRTGIVLTPANPDGAYIVPDSGFEIQVTMDKQGAQYFVRYKKMPKANNGAQGGVIPEADQARQDLELKVRRR